MYRARLFLLLVSSIGSLPASAQLSIPNPGLNGPPGSGVTPPGWVVCMNTPDTNDGTIGGTTLAPLEGSTFMSIHPLPVLPESAAATLSEPMVMGASYEFTMALAIAGLNLPASTTWIANNQGNNPGIVEIWGSTTGCTLDELLWTSPVILPGTGWTTVDVSLTPSADYSHLVFIPQIPSGESLAPFMGIDDISLPATPVPSLGRGLQFVLALLLMVSTLSMLRSERNRPTRSAE